MRQQPCCRHIVHVLDVDFKVVDRLGTTGGETIKFFQPKKCGDIKSRQEWLDAFVADYTVNPGDPLPPPFKPRKKPRQPQAAPISGFGFDIEKLLD